VKVDVRVDSHGGQLRGFEDFQVLFRFRVPTGVLQLEPFTEDQGRPAVRPVRASRSSASLRIPGFRTRRLARMSDYLVRVTRRVGWGARRPLQRSAPRDTPFGARVPAVPTTATGGT